MKKIEEEIKETLSESLADARHSVFMEDFKQAKEFLKVADKCFKALDNPKE